MGIFDRFRRAAPTADDVLESLRAACKGQQWDLLSDLCNHHRQVILDRFAAWRKLPRSVKDRQVTDEYVHTLVTIAGAFRDAGQAELWEMLTGDEQSNPLIRWQNDYERAESLVTSDEFRAAIPLLTDCLNKYAEADGPGADHFLPRTHGLLGIAYFHTGDLAKARDHTETALAICRRLEDLEGLEIYRESLRAIQEGAD